MSEATVFDKLIIKELPEELRDIGTKLINYGFRLRKDAGGIWVVSYPEGDLSGYSEVAFHPVDLTTGLLRILRTEEQARGILFRYEQFDKQWGSKVYGVHKGDTTIAAAGCGPTSLAIVLQYLMNNGSRPRSACRGITPDQTAKYAETHGRVSGRGTSPEPMIRGIKENWPDFDGSKVSLQEAIDLLEEGKLIIFLCKGCRGYTRNRDIHRQTDVTYGGHYMVLAGVEGFSIVDRIFYVVDPGRNSARAMRLIKQPELMHRTGGFWWVYEKGEPARRVSTAE
jgi:hypothetical protein